MNEIEFSESDFYKVIELLNVRQGQGTATPILGLLSRGARVRLGRVCVNGYREIVDQKFRTLDGRSVSGWVNADFVEVESS